MGFWSRTLMKLEASGITDVVQRTTRVPELAYRIYDRAVGPLTVPLAGHPLQRGEPFTPFFIVGAGRSGTTLVRRICCGHPHLHVPPEARIAMAIRVYRRNRRLVWDDLVRVTLAAFAMNGEFEDFEMRLAPLYRKLARMPKEQRSLARILDVVYRAHGEQFGVDVWMWGDKTPSNARFLPRIDAVFPRCKVIHVLRDGVDVAYSSVKAGVAPDLRAAALRWRTEATAAARWVEAHPERSLTVRYEQLVADPRAAAESICGLLGIDYLPSMLTEMSRVSDIQQQDHMQNVLRPISTASVGRGRKAYAEAPEPALGVIMDGALHAFGYPAVGAGPP